MVTSGCVRVTVLTDRLLRLEYAADSTFEDRGSTAVVNRRFPAADFQVNRNGDRLEIHTDRVALRITDTSRALSARTTSARIGRGRRVATWRFGERARSNLGGTARTLDNCRGRQVRELVDLDADGNLVFSDWHRWDIEPGLLSRDGWVVVDDSRSPVFDPSVGRRGPARGRGWPVARPGGMRQDIYLLAYGTDHRQALGDTATLFGPQPLPPRYAFGYWYSRFYAYTDRELLGIVEQFDSMGVPLDVVVVDMDWHLTGWTGYSWDRRYFPDPSDTLERLHEKGLRVTLNVHPADGVGPHEDAYPTMCAELDVDPTTAERIPFQITDPRFVDAYFEHLHHPEERRGVDFWWMDWQQGTTTAVEGLDPLPWLNELHWTDQAANQPARRPLAFSRWGGLGGGRYPIGFSGDTWSTWDSLAVQPWFTATAANVGYGYWSHDIGGHQGQSVDPELYTRWLQFGAFSPILRTHSTKDLTQERRFWEFRDPYRSAMIQAVKQRYELVPYLYGQCRAALDSGVSALRPMYIDHPESESAYDSPGQYCFGDSLIVAPVVEPVGDDEMAPVRVWLPKGRWYDTALGQQLIVRSREGAWFDRRYLLGEVPVFAAQGAVVPGQQGQKRLDKAHFPDLVITAFPGGDGEGELYEDDGISTDYIRGGSVLTKIRQRVSEPARTLRITAAKGDYPGWLRHRRIEVRFVAEAVPKSVSVDGSPVQSATHPDGSDSDSSPWYWWYDASTTSVVVCGSTIDLRSGTTVRVRRDPDSARSAKRNLDGFQGVAARLDAIALLLGQVSPPYQLHPEERLAVDLAQAANRATRDPSTAHSELRRARRSLGRLAGVLAAFEVGWRDAVALAYPEQREASVAIVSRARAVLTTTLEQFG